MEKISPELKSNVDYIDELFNNAIDFTERKFKISNVDAVLFSLDGLVNKEHISIAIMNPIMRAPVIESDGKLIMKFLSEEILGAVEQLKITLADEIVEKLMSGFCVLLIDGCDYALAFGTQGFEKRGIQEPDNEAMQRGAREGFVEAYQTNISLIRRRMKSTDLKFERMIVGSESKTAIALCYIEGKVKRALLEKVKTKLISCDLKTVMAAGYLSGYLRRSKLFGNVGLTERPDTLCGKIMEGRIGIIVDGTPTVIVVPHLFIENFQTLDDYANRPFYATFTRWIRYISFVVAVFMPGLYVSIVIHRPELLPDTLLIKFAEEEAKTPFSVIAEVLLVNFLYEIMREAGLRAPKVLSQSVSIVGALVIGDTAVASGLISAPSLMVIASAAIAGYAIPKLYEQLSIVRFAMIIVGGFLGPWGIYIGAIFLIYNICSEESFGVPVTTPVSPFSLKSMSDVLVRAPWRLLVKNDANVEKMPGTEE